MKSKKLPLLCAAAAVLVTSPAVAQTKKHHRTTHPHVLVPYRGYQYRGDWYNGDYFYGDPTPTRGFWGKGTSQPQYRRR